MTAPVTPIPVRTTAGWALALGSLTSFLVGLDALVVTTALPTLHQEYGGGVEVLGWTVNAYQLGFAASILTGSALGDRFGRRRMFVAGLAVFTAASAACALSPDVGTLIAARAVQGVGGGIAVPLSLALIIDAVPPEARGRALGVWGAVTGVAVATGPLVGGAVVEGLAWQWIFWLNVPVGTMVAVAAVRKVDESTRAFSRRVDLVGLGLATLGVFAVAQALVRGESAGWSSPSIVAGLTVGTAALVLFVAWERRTGHPMMPMALFADRGLTAGCVAGFGLMAGVFGLGFLTAQYLQLVLGHGPLGVGLRLLPATGMALLLSPLAGRLADRIGEKPLVTVGLGLEALGLLLTGTLAGDTTGYATIVGPLLVTGVGIAVAFPTVAAAVLRSARPAEAGMASGVGNTFRQVGAVFGVAVTTAVFAAQGDYRTPEEFLDGFRPAFVVLAALCVLTAVAGLVIWRPSRSAIHDPVTVTGGDDNAGAPSAQEPADLTGPSR